MAIVEPPPSANWTTINEYRWTVAAYQLQFWIPETWVGAFVCLLALITAFAYRKQRQFPITLATWTLMIDFIKFVKEIFKWTIFQDEIVWYPSDSTCAWSMAFDSWAESGQAITNVFMAFVLYISIVRKIDCDPDVNPWYRRGMVIGFWAWTIVWTANGAALKGWKPTGGTCNAFNSQPGWNYAQFGMWGAAFVVETVFIALCYSYTRTVLAAQKNGMSAKEKALAFLVLRFISIMLSQLLPGIFGNVGNVYSATHGQNSTTLPGVLLTMEFVCYIYDALVIMLINRHFRRSVRKTYHRIFGIESDGSSSSTGSGHTAKNSVKLSKKSGTFASSTNSSDFSPNLSNSHAHPDFTEPV